MKPKRVTIEGDRSLTMASEMMSIITLSEASELTGVQKKSILMRVLRGDIAGRQSGSIWLVLLDDLLKFYPLSLHDENGENE